MERERGKEVSASEVLDRLDEFISDVDFLLRAGMQLDEEAAAVDFIQKEVNALKSWRDEAIPESKQITENEKEDSSLQEKQMAALKAMSDIAFDDSDFVIQFGAAFKKDPDAVKRHVAEIVATNPEPVSE